MVSLNDRVSRVVEWAEHYQLESESAELVLRQLARSAVGPQCEALASVQVLAESTGLEPDIVRWSLRELEDLELISASGPGTVVQVNAPAALRG